MVDDVIVNKVATIERCLARVCEEYGGDERNLRDNLTRQDSIILNLQRACEASIDLAMALVKVQLLTGTGKSASAGLTAARPSCPRAAHAACARTWVQAPATGANTRRADMPARERRALWPVSNTWRCRLTIR